MNQLCKVCGEPAAGFHFGAFTCEGCKSFFGRTYNNLSSISECKNNGECVINKKNRTACKACRLRKCILVGMSKSGSRYGRRSNWFKIHCLLQEQQQTGNHLGASAGLLRPHPYLSPLFRPTPTTTLPLQDSKSSESDSGASSADMEDESRSAGGHAKSPISPGSDRDYFSGSSSKKHSSPASDSEYFTKRKIGFPPISCASPASLPAVSPSGLAPKWMPPLPPFSDPSSWKDIWLRIPPPIAAPAPGQDQPIDLSIKSNLSLSTPIKTENVVVNVGETLKAVPLDLTLTGQTTNV